MTKNEQSLRDIFRRMDGDRAQQIRNAYYKAVEGLQALANALEFADLDTPGDTIELLIGEHLLAVQALETMDKSQLGRVL